jgi:hypothetical protein
MTLGACKQTTIKKKKRNKKKRRVDEEKCRGKDCELFKRLPNSSSGACPREECKACGLPFQTFPSSTAVVEYLQASS